MKPGCLAFSPGVPLGSWALAGKPLQRSAMRLKLTGLSDWLWRDFFLKLLLILIFSYLVFRAYLLSITHDEALTILSQRSQSVLNIILFIPVFTLFAFIIWREILKHAFRVRVVANTILFSGAIIILFHYISCLNLSHTFDWRYDASTKAAMARIFGLEKEINPGQELLTIGATWWLVPAIDYYLLKHGGRFKFMEPRGPETLGPDGRHDFYYLHAADKEILTKRQVKILARYTLSNTYLGVPSSLLSQ